MVISTSAIAIVTASRAYSAAFAGAGFARGRVVGRYRKIHRFDANGVAI